MAKKKVSNRNGRSVSEWGRAMAQRIKSATGLLATFASTKNLSYQITDNFDVLIMVSKGKFQKELNGKTRFA
jgi:hypothetical protein